MIALTEHIHLELKFEPRDLWIGVYWKYRRSIESRTRWFDLYICILPTLLIHIMFTWGWKIRDKAYETYCQRVWEQGMTALDYREWKHNRDKYGDGY